MGILKNFLFSIKYKQYQDVGKGFILATPKKGNGGKEMLYDGKIMMKSIYDTETEKKVSIPMKNIDFVTLNMFRGQDFKGGYLPSYNPNHFCVVYKDGLSDNPHIDYVTTYEGGYNNPTEVIIGNDEKLSEFYAQKLSDNVYIINDSNFNKKVLLFMKKQKLTEEYVNIEKSGKNFKVYPTTDSFYYIEESGNMNNLTFDHGFYFDESDPDKNGNTIASFYANKKSMDVLLNSDKEEISDYYPKITKEKFDILIAQDFENKAEKYVILSPAGQKISCEFKEYEILCKNQVLIKNKFENTYEIITKRKDGVYHTAIKNLKNPVVDSKTGIVMVKMGQRLFIFGNDINLYEVDYHAGKIIMDKLMGKQLPYAHINSIYNSNINVEKNLEIFEEVLSNNLKESKGDKEAIENALRTLRSTVIRSLQASSSIRITKAEKINQAALKRLETAKKLKNKLNSNITDEENIDE